MRANGLRSGIRPSTCGRTRTCLYVEAELPGLQIGDLEIYVTGGNQLSLGGERKPPTVEGAPGIGRSEATASSVAC